MEIKISKYINRKNRKLKNRTTAMDKLFSTKEYRQIRGERKAFSNKCCIFPLMSRNLSKTILDFSKQNNQLV